MGDYIMIEKFTVSNFKGFNDEIIFDLSKSRDYTFNSHLIKDGLVNKGIIYGKNGSGKSNLGFALYDLTSHLTDKKKPAEIYMNSYTNLDNPDKLATFEYCFRFNNQKITYIYIKSKLDELLYEQVEVDHNLVLTYNYVNHQYKITGITGTENLRLDLPDNKLSILKYIYKNTPTNEESPITKIIKFAEGMLWFRCLTEGNNFISFRSDGGSMDEIIINNNKLQAFQDFLQKNGLNYELMAKDVNNSSIIFIKFKNGEANFSSIISSGTRALWLYFCWSIYFENVSFLFLDEFDAYYHYETAEMIIRAINDNQNIQAFVTSHNTYLMRNSITRPDCCFILSHGQITSLSDCTDKEIREAHNLEKMYRNGAFTE